MISGNVVKPMVFRTFAKAETTTETTETNVDKTIGFAFFKKHVAKPLGFTTFSKTQLLTYLTVAIF